MAKTLPANSIELYRSRPSVGEAETMTIVIAWQVLSSAVTAGDNGLVATTEGSLPAYGDALSDWVTGYSWTGFTEPRIEKVETVPHNIAGFHKLIATFVGWRALT